MSKSFLTTSNIAIELMVQSRVGTLINSPHLGDKADEPSAFAFTKEYFDTQELICTFSMYRALLRSMSINHCVTNGFHPDSRLEEYVDESNERIFDDVQAKQGDAILDCICYTLTEKGRSEDIYTFAQHYLQLLDFEKFFATKLFGTLSDITKYHEDDEEIFTFYLASQPDRKVFIYAKPLDNGDYITTLANEEIQGTLEQVAYGLYEWLCRENNITFLNWNNVDPIWKVIC